MAGRRWFPAAGAHERARKRRVGLPYPAEPAITHHLAEFLQRHAVAAREALGSDVPDGASGFPLPDTLLLNGGVFRAPALARRLCQLLESWRGQPLRLLHNDAPDFAVAQALPRGTPEGSELALPGRCFALRFHLASATGDAAWQAGELVELDAGRFVRLPVLAPAQGQGQGNCRAEVTVELLIRMTEVGTLEVHCVACDDPAQRWQLAFQLRGSGAVAADGADETDGSDDGPITHPRLAEALALFDALLARAQRRSAEHERAWLDLAGYCLRPGTGAPLDDWRVAQLWELYPQGLQFGAESNNWSEW